MQSSLWAAPTTPEYLPAGQFTQVMDSVAATTSEYVPAAQSVQSAVPVVDLYLPAWQAPHCSKMPEYPALHSQALDPECDIEFAGQLVQTAEAASKE